ncbi:hypothetical protein BSR09_00460 [Stutzerimonas degradans]|nr:hypothetical protein BSR09_00460 [Stutzerimonas degradans]
MTVQTSTNVAGFVGNGVTTSFPIAFKFNSSADLIVEATNTVTGVTTNLSLNSDYTVTGAGDENGGTITFTAAPLSTETVKATRHVDLLQLTDLRNQGKFYAEVHEDVFDKLVMIDQQQQTEINDANAKSNEAVATADLANEKSDQAVAKADQNLIDMQAQYDAFEQGASLVVIGDYAVGLVVDAYNKVFRKDGEFYRAKAETTLPYQLSGDWAVDAPNFVSVGDAVLRQELASSSGSAQIGHLGRTVLAALTDIAWVTDHGAAMIGGDDRAALMAAIATGKQVAVPSGAFVANLLAEDVPAFIAACNRIHWFCDSWVVNLPAGVFDQADRTVISMTNASRGQIRGAAPVTLTFSSLGAVSSTGAGDHSVTINFADASQVQVGDWIICRALTGTRQAVMRGMWEVTGKVGNAVTLKNTARVAALPTLNITGGSFFLMRTVLRYPNNTVGLYVNCEFGVSSQLTSGIRDLAVVGSGAGAGAVGVFVETGCQLTMRYEVGIANFGSHGIEGIYGAIIRAQNSAVSGCGENAYYALAGVTIEAVGGCAGGNGGYGFVSTTDSNITCAGFSASGNANGVSSAESSTFTGDNGFIEDNVTTGNYTSGLSKARIRSASVRGNQSGLRVDENSIVDFTSATSADNSLNAAIIEDANSRIVGGTLTGTVRRNGSPAQFIQASGALNFGSVAAGAEALLTISVPGVTTTKCGVSVSSNVNTAGIFFDAYVSAADTVTVRAHNRTTGSVSVANRTFYLTATFLP